MFQLKYTIVAIGLLVTNLTYAADSNKPDTGLNSQKNPFTRSSPNLNNGMGLPNGLPQGANVVTSGNINNALPTGSARGVFSLDENSNEQKTDWDNLKVVGFLNNYVILRLEDNNNNNSNGGYSNNNSGNSNSGYGNSNNGNGNNYEAKTIFTELDAKFFLNRNQYYVKYNNRVFTIYNKNNQPVHKLTIGNGAAHLIPRGNNNSSSSGGYNLNVNSGNQNGSGK